MIFCPCVHRPLTNLDHGVLAACHQRPLTCPPAPTESIPNSQFKFNISCSEQTCPCILWPGCGPYLSEHHKMMLENIWRAYSCLYRWSPGHICRFLFYLKQKCIYIYIYFLIWHKNIYSTTVLVSETSFYIFLKCVCAWKQVCDCMPVQ